MIASLVALSASSMPARRSFCLSALAFSSARSKFSSATDTFSAMRPISAMISSSLAQDFSIRNSSTPMLLPALMSGSGFSAVNRGIADELVELLFGLGAKNRLVGGADGAEHPVQPSQGALAALARSLVLEIVERI